MADPLKLYDCCPFTDGGAALVLVSEEVARRARRPIWVLASAAAADWMLIGDKRDLSRVPATERAAAAAYRQAGKRPEDVFIVRSGPDLSRFKVYDPDPKWRKGKPFLIAYLGEICKQDGVDHLPG